MNLDQSYNFLLSLVDGVSPKDENDFLVSKEYVEQSAFIRDSSKSIAVLGSRRSGKTHGTGSRLFRAAHSIPRSVALYVALTRDSAKSIMWPVLFDLSEKFGIKCNFIESSLTVELSNGSIIKLVGADMKNFINRLRGSKYSEVCVDEIQSFSSHLKTLIDDVVKPALIDYDGALVVTGTPGPIPEGYFYNVTNMGQGNFSQHRLSLFRNPFLPNARKWLDNHKSEMGWKDDNPTLRREYYGEWVIDREALVYAFDRDRNVSIYTPELLHAPRFVVGLDLGFNDKTAISVVAYSTQSKIAYVVYCDGRAGLSVTEIATWLKEIVAKYKPTSVQCDTGGLGKTIAHELSIRHHIYIEPAEKTDKMSWVALLNDQFRNQKLFVDHSLEDLQSQYITLTKTPDGKEDPKLPNDLLDATLYASRKVFNHMGINPKEKPNYGSKAWAEEEEKRIIENEIRIAKEREDANNDFENYI